MKDFTHYSLLDHNTFGIDVTCRRFVEFEKASEVTPFVCSLSEEDKPLLMIGAGSNLLLTGDFEGTVLHSAIKGVESTTEDGHVLLRCGSGETWDDIVSFCVDHGWYGLENLSHIPGEVGASAIQNIGAYGAEVKNAIWNVEAVDMETGVMVNIDQKDCGYGYRDSRFKHEWKNKYFITAVTYRLSENFTPVVDYGNIRQRLEEIGITKPSAQQLREVVISIRDSKLPDPKIEGNAGSFFVNPVVSREKFLQIQKDYPGMPHYPVDERHEKIPAGWLIEQCGWKGKTLGRAGVHDKQALVLVNKGGATGNEILRLCETVKADVLERFGIEISSEVNII